MKRAITGIIAILVIIACFIAAIPFLVSTQTVRNGITAKIEELTGREVTFQGNPSLSFSPFLGFEISDLELIDPNNNETTQPLFKVEKVKAQIDLLPALTGKVEITEYQFLRPKIFLQTDKSGNNNWDFNKGSLTKALKIANDNRANQTTNTFSFAGIGNLLITDGILIYENEVTNTSKTVTSMNGMISWPDLNSQIDITGNGIWRGEGITTNAKIKNPIEILSGGESPVTIDLNSQPLSFIFDGTANMLANLFVKGELEAKTPSINRLAEILETDLGDFSSSEEWNAKGLFEATANNTNLSQANFSIGENTATGVIRVSALEDGKSKLDGTLAFETIDLVDYFNSLGLTSETKIQPEIISDLNIDLRISSQVISVGTITLDKVAAAIIMDNQGWTFDIGDASAFNGKLVAKLGERLANEKRQAFLDISATDMDADSITKLLGAETFGISGKTSFVANVRSNKLKDGLLKSGLNGSFSGKFSDGEITGIDLNELISDDSQDAPINLTGFDNDASTAYQTMDIKLFLNNGIATVSKTKIQTDSIMIQAIGEIDLPEGKLNLQLQELSDQGPKQARYLIKGFANNPSFTRKSDVPVIDQN